METKGLLLQAIPYLGKKQILKVFSEESGLISMMADKQTSSPFCICDWVYEKKQGDLFRLKESSLIDPLLELRQSLEALNAAGSMAQSLLLTQWPGKKDPPLYLLASTYFKKLCSFENPEILALSFQIKLLLHEGFLNLQNECSLCQKNASALTHGESICMTHASLPSIRFSPTEWEILQVLAFSRKFSLLEPLKIPSDFPEKIHILFKDLFL